MKPGCWNGPPGWVMGSRLAGVIEPILLSVFWPKWFHWKPSSRPAWRDASTNRTSSMTCWGDITWTALMTPSGANWRAMTTALSRVCASGALPESMMRPFTELARMPLPTR